MQSEEARETKPNLNLNLNPLPRPSSRARELSKSLSDDLNVIGLGITFFALKSSLLSLPPYSSSQMYRRSVPLSCYICCKAFIFQRRVFSQVDRGNLSGYCTLSRWNPALETSLIEFGRDGFFVFLSDVSTRQISF